jgi:predicted phage replisome organizer
MSDNKKYYYLKLKYDFFDSDEIILLESMQDGMQYVNILLKLYLRSLKKDGLLRLSEYIPYNPKMLATITRHTVGTLEKAIDVFKKLGLVEVLDTGEIFLNNIQNFIGKSSSEGDRKREQRKQLKSKDNIIGQMSDKCPPELETETELEKDIKEKIYKKEMFDNCWSFYPKRQGSNSKENAYKQWKARLKQKHGEEEMLSGVKRYQIYCNKTGKTGSEYVMMASTFLGVGEHFTNEWSINNEQQRQQTNVKKTAREHNAEVASWCFESIKY